MKYDDEAIVCPDFFFGGKSGRKADRVLPKTVINHENKSGQVFYYVLYFAAGV